MYYEQPYLSDCSAIYLPVSTVRHPFRQQRTSTHRCAMIGQYPPSFGTRFQQKTGNQHALQRLQDTRCSRCMTCQRCFQC
ncbi:hypothetical protein HanIR_Chr05g0208511 [Helianthus annuus]|nr:hypothetical protein HanIR_Chr05g0208511 [Helianthus annuus]